MAFRNAQNVVNKRARFPPLQKYSIYVNVPLMCMFSHTTRSSFRIEMPQPSMFGRLEYT